MPELPEVENVKLSLEKLKGKTVKTSRISLSKLIKTPDNLNSFQKNIIGLKFEQLNRRGKYLILDMSQGYKLIVHLGMTGLLINVKKIEDIPDKYFNHLHITLDLDDNSYLCYCDIRRFGSMRLLNNQQFSQFKSLNEMGPEPFNEDIFDLVSNKLLLKKWQKKTIKEVLMDQTIIAGVGNIYACEALYKSQINPNRLVSTITKNELELLLLNIKNILLKSINLGGTSVSDYLNGEGKSGQYQNYLEIYQKKKCPLGHDVSSTVIKGRNTFYCDKCQF